MRRAAAVLCLIAAVVCAAGGRTRAAVAAGAMAPGRVGIASIAALPLGFEWPAGDASSPVLQAVAADIDADGDLDVVANQGSIDLAVWINDGTGRLTRATATPPAAPDALSTSPGIADPVRGGSPTLSTAAPVSDFAPGCASEPLAGSGAPLGPPAVRAFVDAAVVRSPRAPPIDLLS